MRIYLIGMYENPTTETIMAMKHVGFAHFSAVGTWVSARDRCAVCGWHWQDYGPPLLVQWEPSTDSIGDFSWDGPFGYTFIVKVSVAQRLQALQFECRFLPIEHIAPERRGKAKCVSFPYTGPKLVWGVCETYVELDMQASAVAVTHSCSVCGYVRHTFRNNGIVIRRKDWHGEQMFRITTNDNAAATFVTEEGRRLLEREGLSNIAFSEAGKIIT